MAKQEQKRKRKSTKKKTESTMSIEIVMAILILIQFLAIFKCRDYWHTRFHWSIIPWENSFYSKKMDWSCY